MKHLRAFAALATIAPLLVPGVSLGQEDPKAPAEPEDAQGAPAQKEPPPDNGSSPSAIVGEGRAQVVAPGLPDQARIAHINRIWRTVGIGYANGVFGQSFGQSLRLDLPFGRRLGQFMGVRVEGRYINPPAGTPSPYDPVITTGLSFFGRTPVWLGLIRAYGGGGMWVGMRPDTSAGGDMAAVSGGGFFGTEVLVSDHMSFTFEVGGQGPVHALRHDDAGASVMGGFLVYLGSGEPSP